jgi:hypothetical protein
VWSHGGTGIVFRSDRTGGNFPFGRPSAGDAPEQLLRKVETLFPTDWSKDDLVFHVAAGSNYDVGVLNLADQTAPRFIAQTPATEIDGRVSPNGKWIAYSSDASEQMEVYVAPFPRSGGKIVSVGGGSAALERQRAGAVLPAADRRIMAIAVGRNGTFNRRSSRGVSNASRSQAACFE